MGSYILSGTFLSVQKEAKMYNWKIQHAPSIINAIYSTTLPTFSEDPSPKLSRSLLINTVINNKVTFVCCVTNSVIV